MDCIHISDSIEGAGFFFFFFSVSLGNLKVTDLVPLGPVDFVLGHIKIYCSFVWGSNRRRKRDGFSVVWYCMIHNFLKESETFSCYFECP